MIRLCTLHCPLGPTVSLSTMLILHSLLSLSLVLVLSAHAFLLPGRPNRLPSSFELDKRDEHGQWVATPGLPAEGSDTTMGICPAFEVKCVLDRDWRHPVGYLGKRRKLDGIEWIGWENDINQPPLPFCLYLTHPHPPSLPCPHRFRVSMKRARALTLAFCRVGLRCNQCEEERNTRECNRMFREECKGRCEAYGPVPF